MTREQIVLFAPTLADMIADDETVRLVDEVLRQRDWTDWEAHYDGQRGQPPIHPRVMASAILYGLCRGVRCSRKLEYACRYNLDFIWLVESRTIDHTTFAKFRTEFNSKIRDLFRQLGRGVRREDRRPADGGNPDQVVWTKHAAPSTARRSGSPPRGLITTGPTL
jgi:transposase